MRGIIKIKKLTLFSLIIMIMLSFYVTSLANSAEPPSITIEVTEAPEDLSMGIVSKEDISLASSIEDIELIDYYRNFGYKRHYEFYEHGIVYGDYILLVETGEKRYQIEFPEEQLLPYNEHLYLDLETMTISIEESGNLNLLLFFLRVFFTLIIEGAVFFLFKYRAKLDWLIFFAVNLLTQTLLNLLFWGPSPMSYWLYLYLFAEAVIFIFEMIVFGMYTLIKEKDTANSKSLCFLKGAGYAFTANLASLVLGGYLISLLPIQDI